MLWNARTGRFDPALLLFEIVRRGFTPTTFAEVITCSRTSLYKALQGKGVRDATALAILEGLQRHPVRLPELKAS